jgi:hypothetical protein
LWLLANPLWTHGIGESGSNITIAICYLSAAYPNHICWVYLNPISIACRTHKIIASCTFLVAS